MFGFGSKTEAPAPTEYVVPFADAPQEPAPLEAPEETPEEAPFVAPPEVAWLKQVETEGARDLYPMPQELQPHPIYGFDPLPEGFEAVESLAEEHVGDPGPGGEHPQ